MRPIYNIPLIYQSADHSSYRIGFKYRVISIWIETDSFTVGWSSWYCWKCGEETQSTHSSYWGVQGKGMWYFEWCEDDFTLWPKYFFNDLHFTSIFFLEKKNLLLLNKERKGKVFTNFTKLAGTKNQRAFSDTNTLHDIGNLMCFVSTQLKGNYCRKSAYHKFFQIF